MPLSVPGILNGGGCAKGTGQSGDAFMGKSPEKFPEQHVEIVAKQSDHIMKMTRSVNSEAIACVVETDCRH